MWSTHGSHTIQSHNCSTLMVVWSKRCKRLNKPSMFLVSRHRSALKTSHQTERIIFIARSFVEHRPAQFTSASDVSFAWLENYKFLMLERNSKRQADGSFVWADSDVCLVSTIVIMRSLLWCKKFYVFYYLWPQTMPLRQTFIPKPILLFVLHVKERF